MKKFKRGFWSAIIVSIFSVSLVWGAADNRRSFDLLNVTLVKIADDLVTVRNSEGKLLNLEVSPELRKTKLLSKHRAGDKVRVQIRGNSLIQVQADQRGGLPEPIPKPQKNQRGALPEPIPNPK